MYVFILANYSNQYDFIVSQIIDRFQVCLINKSNHLQVNKSFVGKKSKLTTGIGQQRLMIFSSTNLIIK
jgi:hypothetical protein